MMDIDASELENVPRSRKNYFSRLYNEEGASTNDLATKIIGSITYRTVSHSQPSLSVAAMRPPAETNGGPSMALLHSIQEESPQIPHRVIPANTTANYRAPCSPVPVPSHHVSRPYPLTPQHYRHTPPPKPPLPPIASDPRRRRVFNAVPIYNHMLQQQQSQLGNGGSMETATSAGMTDSGYSEHNLNMNGTIVNGNGDNVSKMTIDSSTRHSDTMTHNATQFDEQDLVFDETGQILGGSLRALMKRFIPRRDHCPDRTFIFTFLLNARIFISPADLLHQILQSCMFEQNADGDNFKKERRTRFFQNILKLTKEWSESFPYDFVDETMLRRLKELLSLCCADQSSHAHANGLVKNLMIKLTKLERYEKALADIQTRIKDQLQPSDQLSGVLTTCDSARILAHQLMHIELERLSMIGANEYVEYFTKSSTIFIENNFEQTSGANSDGVSKKSSCRRPDNIMQYVDWSNRLTALVSSEITRNLRKRHRARTLDFFIDVAKECFNIGNFNSLMAISAALDSGTITRLRKTWARSANANQWDVIKHQCDPSSNFSSYRCTLKAAVWRASQAVMAGKDSSVTNSSVKVVVPFFTLELKDLTVRHAKCRRRLPNGHWNFTTFTQFADAVRQLQRWKQADFTFERDTATLQYLLTTPVFTEKGLQLASFECEPPESAADKERHKKLKVEFQWK